MCLKNKIEQTEIGKDEVAIFWLGQAGFLVKEPSGKTLVIDPYLSDSGFKLKEYKKFKRISPILIDPADLDVDYFITTHIHFDHLDIETVPVVADKYPTTFLGTKSCVDMMLDMKIAKERIIELNEGVEQELEGFKILPTHADHGDLVPDCIGVYLEIGKHKLYFSGDTAYRPEKIQNVADLEPHVAFLSVNGAFGNLNVEEGAKVANIIGAKMAVPCHLWTFMEHGGDMAGFDESVRNHAPGCEPYFMRHGECLILK